jgi:hypothetical protein
MENNEKKTCATCKIEKEFKEFVRDKTEKDGYTYSCKVCRREKYNLWAKNNPDKVKEKNLKRKESRKAYYRGPSGIESSRRAHLKRNYGMTLEEYNRISEAQNHVCMICGKPEMNSKNKVLCVDHNHTTGEIRGLLCGLCNSGLGNFLDNKELLMKGIEYLNKYEK